MKKELYYEKKGIKSYTTYTTAYHGILVKDYGFHAMIKSLRKQFPQFYFETGTPVKGSKELIIDDGNIEIHLKTNLLQKPIKLLAVYDAMNHKWYFIDEKVDEYINIKKLLTGLRKK